MKKLKERITGCGEFEHKPAKIQARRKAKTGPGAKKKLEGQVLHPPRIPDQVDECQSPDDF